MRRKVAERYAFYEYGWNKDSDTLVIAFGITRRDRPAAGSAFRALPADPHLAHPGQGAGRDRRRATRRSSSSRAATGSTPTSWSGCFFRRVERVPLLGGRMSLEAIREGLDRIGLLPKESSPAAAKAPAKEGAKAPAKPGAKAPAQVG